MFDKIPSLKDFIIYFIPGALICFFTLNIFSLLSPGKIKLTLVSVSSNSVLIFIGILFSFLVGFIFSQIQIIVFNFFINHNGSKIRKLESASMSAELKNKTAEKIITVFSLNGIQNSTILDDSKMLHLCLNYVKSKANEEVNFYINRSSNLSSFASASTIPLLLGIWNFALLFDMPVICLSILMLLSCAAIITLNGKITLNFRKEWINSVYKQFLIL